MSGDIVVSSERVEQQFYFTRIREGWFEAWCNRCDASTTGADSVVEEWAYEHLCPSVPVNLDLMVGHPLNRRPLRVTDVVAVQVCNRLAQRIYLHREDGTMWSTTNYNNEAMLEYISHCQQQGVLPDIREPLK